ncbi:hypothetical protein [Klebsiella variicola]
MKEFTFYNPTRIEFGSGKEDTIGAHIASAGARKPDAKRPCSLSGELNLYKEMSVLNKKVLSLIQDVAGCNHMSPAEAVEWLDTHLLIR